MSYFVGIDLHSTSTYIGVIYQDNRVDYRATVGIVFSHQSRTLLHCCKTTGLNVCYLLFNRRWQLVELYTLPQFYIIVLAAMVNAAMHGPLRIV